MRVRLLLVVAVVLSAAGLWAASHSETSSPEATVPTSPAPGSPAPASSAPDIAPSTSVGELPSSEDSMSVADQRQVVAFAARFASAFARPVGRTDYRAWWRDVAAMMTDDAANDFMGIDPSEVPYTKVTGPIALLGESDAEAYWLQRVAVPTDAGIFVLQVQVVTPGLSDRLLVSGVEFP